MSERRTIPVAYVTKWATTAGIRIVRDAEDVEGGYLSKKMMWVGRNDWTEDKAEAEDRYRAKIDAARQSAERKVKKLEKMFSEPPKYTEG